MGAVLASATIMTAKLRLANQVAVVTGASRGLGAAIAARLARDGAHVYVNYRSNASAAEELAKTLRAEGWRDLRRSPQCR